MVNRSGDVMVKLPMEVASQNRLCCCLCQCTLRAGQRDINSGSIRVGDCQNQWQLRRPFVPLVREADAYGKHTRERLPVRENFFEDGSTEGICLPRTDSPLEHRESCNHSELTSGGWRPDEVSCDAKGSSQAGANGRTPGAGCRKCTAYHQTGPDGLPAALGLTEGLGIAAQSDNSSEPPTGVDSQRRVRSLIAFLMAVTEASSTSSAGHPLAEHVTAYISIRSDAVL